MIAKAGDLSITCGAFDATDADDFDQLPDDLNSVRIISSGDSRRVEVALGRKVAKVSLIEPDTHVVGILSSIYRITDASRRRSLRLFRWYNIFIAVIGLALFITLGHVYNYSSKLQAWQNITVSIALTAACVGPLIALKPRKWIKEGARIINVDRATRPTFLQRTKDDWIVETTVAAFFLVVGLIIGLISGR